MSHIKRQTGRGIVLSHHRVGIGRKKTLSVVSHAEALHTPRQALLRSTLLDVRVGWTDFIKAIHHDGSDPGSERVLDVAWAPRISVM